MVFFQRMFWMAGDLSLDFYWELVERNCRIRKDCLTTPDRESQITEM